MKKFFYFLLLLAFATTVKAQNPPSGAAGTYYKMMNTNLEKLKTMDYETQKGAYKNALSQASQNLASLKKSAPDYDVSSYEQQIAKYNEVVNAAGSANNLAQDKKQLDIYMEALRNSREADFPRKLDDAQGQLELLKKRTPSYDASAYEKEIASLEAGYNGQIKGQVDAFKFDEKFSELFDMVLDFNSGTSVSEMKSKVAELRQEVAAFASGENIQFADAEIQENNSDRSGSALEKAKFLMHDMYETYIKRNALDRYLEVEDMQVQYYKIQGIYERCKGMNTLFGKVPEVAADFRKIQDIINGLPSLESLAATTEKNATQEVAKRRMQPAVDNNPALVSEFKDAFVKGKFSYSNNVLAIHVVSSTWQIERNQNSIYKEIIGRTKAAEIVVKESDGKCYLYPFILFESYDGSSYQKGRSYKNAYLVHPEILCENAK